MATVSGSFTAVGLSAVLDVPVIEEEITISLTGTWVATVRLERELSPYSGAWEVMRTDTGNYSIVIQQKRKNERYRFNTTAYTSGTVTFSVADGDKRVGGTALLTSDGREVLTYTQAGVQVPGTLAVTGALTLTAAATLASGTAIGNLTLGDGSIVDSSGAISFGDENLTTTGTLASGATTVTGALSSTTTVSGVTGDFEVIEAGDASLGINGIDAAQGGAILITGGTSSTAGNAGGDVDLVGGTPGSTSAGGAVAVTGAIGGSSSGTGGAATLTGGAGTAGDAAGGAVTLEGGLQNGSGANTDIITLGHAGTVITSTPAFRTGANNGTAGTGTTAVEYGDGYNHVTVLTMTSSTVLDTDIDDDETISVGVILYTFPAGVYVGHSIHADLVTITSGDLDNAIDYGLGSLIGSGASATLNGTTMEDWLTAQTIAAASSPATEVSTLMTAGNNLLFEDAGSHVLNLNMGAVWNSAGSTDNHTVYAQGTVIIAWTFLGNL